MATRSKKPKKWRKNFAPKRAPWYTVLSTEIEPRVGITVLVMFAVLLFGGVFSLTSAQSQNSGLTEVAAVEIAPAQQSQLPTGLYDVTRFFHVPGAYIDTSSAPPPVTFLK